MKGVSHYNYARMRANIYVQFGTICLLYTVTQRKMNTSEERESQTTENSVIFFGRSTHRMVTIAKKMFGVPDDCKTLDDEKSDIFYLSHSALAQKLNACFVNLDPTFVSYTTRTRCETIMRYNEVFPRNISLLLFVYERGLFTDEDKGMFEYVLGCFSSRAFDRTVLLITRCEDLNAQAKKKTITDFKTNRRTAGIANRMNLIRCIGFPQLSEVLPELHEAYTKRIEEDEHELRQLLSEKIKHSPLLQTNDIFLDLPCHSLALDRCRKIYSSYCNII